MVNIEYFEVEVDFFFHFEWKIVVYVFPLQGKIYLFFFLVCSRSRI